MVVDLTEGREATPWHGTWPFLFFAGAETGVA